MTTTPETDVRAGLPSASSLARTIDCPGSNNLINSIPKEEMEKLRAKEDDESASSGTLIHAAREKLSDAGLDEEQTQIYNQGCEYERVLVENWMRDKNLAVSQIVEGPREQRLWLHSADLQPMASGQLDVNYLSPPYALVIDWKGLFASHVPPTPRSAQLRLQALLLWQSREDIREVRVAYDKAMLKAKTSTEDVTDYREEDLKFALQQVQYALWLARQPEARRIPGPECRWCPAKPFCREAAAWSLLPSVERIGNDRVSTIPPTAEAMIARASLDDCAKAFRMRPYVEKVLEGMIERLKAQPDEVLALLGFERTKGRANNTIDPVAAYRWGLEHGWTEEEILGCMKVSKEKAALVFVAKEGIAKKHAGKRVDEDWDSFTEKDTTEPGLKMVKGLPQ